MKLYNNPDKKTFCSEQSRKKIGTKQTKQIIKLITDNQIYFFWIEMGTVAMGLN